MNKERRKKIQEVIDHLKDMQNDIEAIKTEEEECMNNMPENLLGSKRFEAAEEASSNLDESFDFLNSAISYLTDAITGE